MTVRRYAKTTVIGNTAVLTFQSVCSFIYPVLHQKLSRLIGTITCTQQSFAYAYEWYQ
jgi:hypothetical protein